MLKRNIELIRNGERQVLLTWRKPDGEGGTIPIGMEFSDAVDAETRQRIIDACERPVNVRGDDGKISKAFYGSSKHFLALPRLLGRVGFRARLF